MLLGVIGLVQAIRSNEQTSPISSWLRIAVVLIASLVYTNLIGSEGFFLPFVIFVVICLSAFGIRNPLLIALFAIAVPSALVLLFNHTLGTPLPTSRFTYLL